MIKYLIPLLLFAVSANAQNITGKILDTNNKPVAGATIVAAPSGNGATSKDDGSFVLLLADKDKHFTVSSVGFQSYIQTRKTAAGF